MLDFYDAHGRPTHYSPDDEHLYSWDGRPAGYLTDSAVYTFTGRFLGWFENGWLRDRANRPVLFSRAAIGGPLQPERRLPALRAQRHVRPLKGLRETRPEKPCAVRDWSRLSASAFFEQ